MCIRDRPSTPARRMPVKVSTLSLIKYIFIYASKNVIYATCVKIRKATINPQRAIPSARATKIRALPKMLESSLNAPRAALAELATA